MNKIGKIIPNGVVLEKHELKTVVFLANQGLTIELIRKSNIEGVHSPDIRIGKIFWEIKCPKGEGNNLMKNTLQKALRQSENVIVDLRRTKRHQTKCIKELTYHFSMSKTAKKLKIITKNNRILDFSN